VETIWEHISLAGRRSRYPFRKKPGWTMPRFHTKKQRRWTELTLRCWLLFLAVNVEDTPLPGRTAAALTPSGFSRASTRFLRWLDSARHRKAGKAPGWRQQQRMLKQRYAVVKKHLPQLYRLETRLVRCDFQPDRKSGVLLLSKTST